MNNLKMAALGLALSAAAALAQTDTLKKVLVYNRAGWYVHPDIGKISTHILGMGKTHGFQVDTTSVAADINATKLAQYQVLVLNNNSEMGNAINTTQQAALKTWFENGGGIVAFHGAGVVRGTWKWYIDLIGTDWSYDAAMQNGRVYIPQKVRQHSLVAGSDTSAILRDEWNNFKINVDTVKEITVVAAIDEGSYDPTNKKNPSEDNNIPGYRMADPGGRWIHPVSWIRTQGKGRIYYSCIGHDISVTSHAFNTHLLLRAMQWTAGALPCSSGEPGCATSVKDFFRFGNGFSAADLQIMSPRLSLGSPSAYEVEVMTLNGERVYRKSGMGPTQIDLSGQLKPGLYSMRLRMGSSPWRVAKFPVF